MTNLQFKTETTKSQRLEIAHNALKKATSKKKISLEDYEDNGLDFLVSWFDENTGDFVQDEKISKSALEDFVMLYYNSVIDRCENGYHAQYEDNTSAADYLEANTNDVLADFLNNRR